VEFGLGPPRYSNPRDGCRFAGSKKVTRRFTAREGVAEQYDYLPGDLREVDFGESAYDVAILGHICHGLGTEDNQKLFRRIHQALKAGGQLLIAEIIPDDERREALFPLLFAVNMLALTTEGDTFTVSGYRQWLQEAGFKDVHTVEAPSPSPLILPASPGWRLQILDAIVTSAGASLPD
jgi:SAM-dependent methyltransferase